VAVVVVADAVAVATAAAAVAVAVAATTAAAAAGGWTVEENTEARLETWDGGSGHPYVWRGQWVREEGIGQLLGRDTGRKRRDGGREIDV
jgi:Spy/CpxP family protein refolding chaperone